MGWLFAKIWSEPFAVALGKGSRFHFGMAAPLRFACPCPVRVHAYAGPGDRRDEVPIGGGVVLHAATPEARVTLTRALTFRGGRPDLTRALDTRHSAVARGELRHVRLLYLVFTMLVFGAGLLMSDSGPRVIASLSVSVGSSCVAFLSLLLRPGWGEGVAVVAAAALIVGLDMRQSVLMSACGGCPDLITLLGVMPFLHCAMLAPRLVCAAPMLAAHAGYAAYLFLTAAPAEGAEKTVVMALCALLTCGHLYVSEHGRRERVLLGWRLERGLADCAAARAAEQKHAVALDDEVHRFESAGGCRLHRARSHCVGAHARVACRAAHATRGRNAWAGADV